jgi:nucleotide-binding universal stress UspA family protein
MTLLVATDGSPSAERAVAFASRLASRIDESLVILHVTPRLPSTKEEVIHLLKEELGSREKAGKKYLRRALAMAGEAGAKAETKLLEGSPAEEILKEAEEGYELIVLGYHGRGKLHEFLLGSVASKVIHLSKIPVLVVK